MTQGLDRLFFRTRENGATVFRLDTENRQRRLDMEQIAVVNIRNGQIRAAGDKELSDQDMAEIREWMAARETVLAEREIDDIRRCIDYLNQTAHWLQTRASDEQLDEVTDKLLLAMHDLRTVLVRKKADRLAKGE